MDQSPVVMTSTVPHAMTAMGRTTVPVEQWTDESAHAIMMP